MIRIRVFLFLALLASVAQAAGFFQQFFHQQDDDDGEGGHPFFQQQQAQQQAKACANYRCRSGECVATPKDCPCSNTLDIKKEIPGGWYICVPRS